MTGLLSVSTAYLQSGVFALAALWPSNATGNVHATLGVISGQGGIAVLVSAVQLILAVVGAAHKQASSKQGDPSLLAGVGLWGLGTFGAIACIWALERLKSERGHSEVVAQMTRRMTEMPHASTTDAAEKIRTRSVLKKNIWLNIAVAWVFTVTLVSEPPVCVRKERVP